MEVKKEKYAQEMKKKKKMQEMNYPRLMPPRKKQNNKQCVLASQCADFISKGLGRSWIDKEVM